jgi:cellulose biosynthesis protein BcsQ
MRIAFFNNKGGVGKTSLVYHVAWMLAELGRRVVAVDLDPQANLTAMFLDEDRLETLWPDTGPRLSIAGALEPILRGTGDIGEPHVEEIDDRLDLLAGDLGLSRFEDKLSDSWPRLHNADEPSFRAMSAFSRLVDAAAGRHEAEIVLIDVGPNLGAINRAALIASEHVIVPLAPDLFSLQGLRNLGPTLRDWREKWSRALSNYAAPANLRLPSGAMRPLGYVVLQHAVRLDRPVIWYGKWMDRIPGAYREAVLGADSDPAVKVATDPHCLASLKHYRSLMPMAMEARRPMFLLKPADGAIGAHLDGVRDCYRDFLTLAERIVSAASSATAAAGAQVAAVAAS